MRDPATFTVDDPRFSTAQVIGPSMLSLDGEQHALHRAPFVGPFRPAAVTQRFTDVAEREAERLIEGLRPSGRGELRRGFAGPMSATIVTHALGLERDEVQDVLGWYDAIVASVTEITAGSGPTASGTEAFDALSGRLERVIADDRSGSLLAAAAADSALSRRRDRVQCGGAAVRRDRDDRGNDRQRGLDAPRAARATGARRAATRRRSMPRSTSRCGSSRRPR